MSGPILRNVKIILMSIYSITKIDCLTLRTNLSHPSCSILLTCHVYDENGENRHDFVPIAVPV